jgi:hypothetical protein
MKALLIALPAMLLASEAAGQAPGVAPPNIPVMQVPGLPSRPITPTMQRQHLERAFALRDEAKLLIEEGGGKLSAKQQRYIRRKAYKILDGSR